MSIVIQLVVGELKLVKTDHLLCPVGSSGRRVWMHMDPLR